MTELTLTTPDLTQRSTAHYNTAKRYGAQNGGNGGFDQLAASMRAGEHGTKTVGWYPTCRCGGYRVRSTTSRRLAKHPWYQQHWLARLLVKWGAPIPCVVLDPFGGAGTVGLVADRLGRDTILIELNPSYIALQRQRLTNDAPLFMEIT